MSKLIKSIRPFFGANNFKVSQSFYRDFGFIEKIISSKLSYFELDGFGFYLQDAYVKDWVDNTMLFLEVNDVESFYETIQNLQLSKTYDTFRVLPLRTENWGKEFFVHDPSGILWHIGTFNK